MNEIEKMYKLARIKPIEDKIGSNQYQYYYPPFTAEKQLELIKWLSSKYGIYIVDKYSIGFGECVGEFCTKKNFEECLAESINHLWQDLTSEEKQKIKEILE